ncbi:protein-histidine N-methyltransferase [Rhodotorula paludigena]|uniref:protein-histidine N-methyltransferase n=1 Tax=Rhodotorula paludigena TaxID=86838 RepID=UPI00317CC59A
MAFSFAFDIDAAELDNELADSTASLEQLDLAEDAAPAASTSAVPHREVPLDTLLATLPPLLSYTPVTVPLSPDEASKSRRATLLRRDLFDARFQVLNQDEDLSTDEAASSGKGKQKEEVFVDEQSDLVKGVYEGGLKTWECSLDLVDCLDQRGYAVDTDLTTERVRGRGVLEVGCGTAVPSCALFARLLNEIRRSPTEPGSAPPSKTRIHLQDYNKQVLSLITLPNLLLTYAQHLATPTSAPDADEEPASSDPLPGELEVTPEFLESFETLLRDENIELRFFEGDWSGMDATVRGSDGPYDLVLTSETVYSIPSLEPLLDLLEAATARPDGLCLVACKRIYFGVGGGELEFRRRVEERGGEVETVWGAGQGKGKSVGVGRTVMRAQWRK